MDGEGRGHCDHSPTTGHHSTEVSEHDAPVGAVGRLTALDEDVSRLDVTMDQARAVKGLQRRRHVHKDEYDDGGWESRAKIGDRAGV
jgi:hypothetical protein